MTIRIIGEINEESFATFSEELDQAVTDGANTINIELMSPGGDAYSALAFYARMKDCPLDVTIWVYGIAASAAVLLLAGADTVLMSKDAWIMVHEDSGKISGDTVSLERESGQMRRMENQWCHLLAKNSNISAKAWSDMHKKTTYLNAKEALKTGLITAVI